MDGTVIGGCGHGRIFDPEKVGPVLVVPKPVKLASVAFDDAYEPSAMPAMEHETYNLHKFSYRDDDGITQRTRLWMPLHIKPNMALHFLIATAVAAKPNT